jgi:hypothetical protein
MHPMKLLGDVGHLESHFGRFGGSALKLFLMHLMELLGDMGHVESRFGQFGNNLSVQDRCTICAKHTLGLEII